MDHKGLMPGLTLKEYKQFRDLVINMILSTDMSRHYELLSKPPCPTRDYKHCLELALHCADVSGSARPWHTCRMWGERVMAEFFIQGDLEKKIGFGPTRPMMDRDSAIISKIQISFIDMIVRPLFIHVSIICPFLLVNSPTGSSSILDQIDYNRSMWQSTHDLGGEEIE
jgi:hypothetical protein